MCFANTEINAVYDKALNAFNAGNKTVALKFFKEVAELGGLQSWHNVGVLYGEINMKEALWNLMIAANSEYRESQFMLGELYREGEVVKKYDYGLA